MYLFSISLFLCFQYVFNIINCEICSNTFLTNADLIAMFGCAANARRWQHDTLLRVAGSNPTVPTSTKRRRETYLSERETRCVCVCVSHLSLAREFHAMMINSLLEVLTKGTSSRSVRVSS